MKQHSATVRYLRIAPRKVRSIADLIRGLSINEAEAQLIFHSRRPAQPLLKLLRSAVSGAKEKKLEIEKLFIKEIRVNQGPMLKRYLPRARGSASPIEKKMSHVTIVLEEHAAPKKNRFTIVVSKKVKTSQPKTGPREKKGEEEEGGPVRPSKTPGFFKRTFSRKAGFAK
ncbi:MAG: 50S ribosomal protein L22 [Patescibacteria group bacterium]